MLPEPLKPYITVPLGHTLPSLPDNGEAMVQAFVAVAEITQRIEAQQGRALTYAMLKKHVDADLHRQFTQLCKFYGVLRYAKNERSEYRFCMMCVPFTQQEADELQRQSDNSITVPNWRLPGRSVAQTRIAGICYFKITSIGRRYSVSRRIDPSTGQPITLEKVARLMSLYKLRITDKAFNRLVLQESGTGETSPNEGFDQRNKSRTAEQQQAEQLAMQRDEQHLQQQARRRVEQMQQNDVHKIERANHHLRDGYGALVGCRVPRQMQDLVNALGDQVLDVFVNNATTCVKVTLKGGRTLVRHYKNLSFTNTANQGVPF